jgi:hypothetical protein
MNLRVLSATLLLLAGGTVARATDIPITGLKLIIVDKTASSGTAKAVFVAKDPGIAKGAGTDPNLIFAELGVAYDAERGLFEMPSGSAWVANKDTIAKYTNGDAPSGGAVKVSIIKPGLLVKVVGKSLGDTAIDISNAPTGNVYVTHSVFNGGEGFRHCTVFGGGCIHKPIAGGTGHKLICKENSSGDPTCAGAPPPACCNLTDPITMCGFVASELTCLAAGGTPGAAGSVCDSATGTCAVSATAGGCCEGVPTPFGDICLAGADMTVGACPSFGVGPFSASAVCSPNGSCL